MQKTHNLDKFSEPVTETSHERPLSKKLGDSKNPTPHYLQEYDINKLYDNSNRYRNISFGGDGVAGNNDNNSNKHSNDFKDNTSEYSKKIASASKFFVEDQVQQQYNLMTHNNKNPPQSKSGYKKQQNVLNVSPNNNEKKPKDILESQDKYSQDQLKRLREIIDGKIGENTNIDESPTPPNNNEEFKVLDGYHVNVNYITKNDQELDQPNQKNEDIEIKYYNHNLKSDNNIDKAWMNSVGDIDNTDGCDYHLTTTEEGTTTFLNNICDSVDNIYNEEDEKIAEYIRKNQPILQQQNSPERKGIVNKKDNQNYQILEQEESTDNYNNNDKINDTEDQIEEYVQNQIDNYTNKNNNNSSSTNFITNILNNTTEKSGNTPMDTTNNNNNNYGSADNDQYQEQTPVSPDDDYNMTNSKREEELERLKQTIQQKKQLLMEYDNQFTHLENYDNLDNMPLTNSSGKLTDQQNAMLQGLRGSLGGTNKMESIEEERTMNFNNSDMTDMNMSTDWKNLLKNMSNVSYEGDMNTNNTLLESDASILEIKKNIETMKKGIFFNQTDAHSENEDVVND